MKQNIIISFLLVAILSTGFALWQTNSTLVRTLADRLAGGDGFQARGCAMTHSLGIAGLGNTIDNVLATSSRRAWARISVGDNATNTVFLSFDEGAKAVANTGLVLNRANGTAGGEATTTPYVEFGLNTDFPYTGAVSATSETGTSTLLVSQCVYAN